MSDGWKIFQESKVPTFKKIFVQAFFKNDKIVESF